MTLRTPPLHPPEEPHARPPSPQSRPRECIRLFLAFARIGLHMVGGGFVMLPLLLREVVNHRRWLTEHEMLDTFALSQSTPGIIAVNTATYVGYRRAGIPGALAATIGVITPALIIITLIAAHFPTLRALPAVDIALGGMGVAVAVLLLFALATLARRAITNALDLLLALAAFTALTLFKLPPVPLLLAALLFALLKPDRPATPPADPPRESP